MGKYQFLHSGNYVKIILHDIPQKPGVVAKISTIVAEQNINIVTLKHSMHTKEKGDFAFTVSKNDADEAIALMGKNLNEIGASNISFKKDLALVFI